MAHTTCAVAQATNVTSEVAPKGGAQEAVSEIVTEDSEVFRLIRHATPEILPSLLAEYGLRLLIHEPRGLLAIRDDSCGTGVVSSVVFLSDERIRTLAQMKVTRIEVTTPRTDRS